MSKVNRFYYIEAKGGTVAHMAQKRMEGDLTWCGLALKDEADKTPPAFAELLVGLARAA